MKAFDRFLAFLRMEVERPVERRVAAAGDQHPAAAEVLHLAHRIEDALALVGFDARGRRALGLERAAAGGDGITTLASIVVPASVETR